MMMLSPLTIHLLKVAEAAKDHQTSYSSAGSFSMDGNDESAASEAHVVAPLYHL